MNNRKYDLGALKDLKEGMTHTHNSVEDQDRGMDSNSTGDDQGSMELVDKEYININTGSNREVEGRCHQNSKLLLHI